MNEKLAIEATVNGARWIVASFNKACIALLSKSLTVSNRRAGVNTLNAFQSFAVVEVDLILNPHLSAQLKSSDSCILFSY